MNLSSKAKKQIIKNLLEMFEKDEITAATIPDHEGKTRLVVLDGAVFSDMKTESDQMKFWIDQIIREIWSMFNEDGSVKIVDIKTVQHLGTFAVDAQSRFFGYNPAEVMKEKLEEKNVQ